jgi:hypothetical protein
MYIVIIYISKCVPRELTRMISAAFTSSGIDSGTEEVHFKLMTLHPFSLYRTVCVCACVCVCVLSVCVGVCVCVCVRVLCVYVCVSVVSVLFLALV